MSNVQLPVNVKRIELKAKVIRADGKVENLDTIAYWEKLPLRKKFIKYLHKGTNFLGISRR